MISASRLVAHIRCSLTLSACAGAGRRSLAVAAANPGLLRLSSPPPTTTGYYHAAVPTCQSLRQVVRRPLTIVSPPRIVVGTATSRRLMSSSGPQYFEGLWYEKYLLLEEYKKEHGNCLVPQSFVYCGAKLGRWVSKQRQLYKNEKISKNRREMLDVLGFSWDPKGDFWELNFALLEQFKEREGHCNAPKSHEEGEVKLGDWLNNQRTWMKEEKLDESHQRRLEELGVSWDPLTDKWEQNFALLEQFKEKEGHGNVPYSYEEDGVKLGAWLHTLRQVRRGNVGGNLISERIERLENLGVLWDPNGDQWERNFALLKQFKEREDHCNVPKSHEEDGIRLGVWLNTQRTSMKEEKLDESYQQRLEELGVSWDPFADQWERNFALLEQFKEREGHCNVPQSHEEDGIKLGSWLNRLRQVRRGNRDGKLSSEQIERLDEIGIRW